MIVELTPKTKDQLIELYIDNRLKGLAIVGMKSNETGEIIATWNGFHPHGMTPFGDSTVELSLDQFITFASKFPERQWLGTDDPLVEAEEDDGTS